MENLFATDLVQTIFKNIVFFIPIIVGLAISIIDIYWKEEDKDALIYFAAAGLAGLIVLLWHFWIGSSPCLFIGFEVTKFELQALIVVAVLALLSILMASGFYTERQKNVSNFVVYFLFMVFGLLCTLATGNLIIMAIGLVTTSTALSFLLKFYGLGLDSGILNKFWIYFMVTDILFVFGAVFFYGATGTFNLGSGAEMLKIMNESGMANYFRIGMAFLGVVLMAKIAAIPFHWWILGITKSDSLPLVSAITVFYRASIMILALRIFAPIVNIWGSFLETPLIAVAVLTMSWANIAAVRERDLKFVTAYSSIAYVGYFLALFPGLSVANGGNYITLMVFIIAFAVMHLGAFAVMRLFSDENRVYTAFEDLDGIGQKKPWVTFLFCFFLLALAGVPPLVTFLARFLLIRSVAESGNYFLLGAIIINMAISVYYYTRPVIRMFVMKPGKGAAVPTEFNAALVTVIVFTALIAIYLGVQPASFIKWLQLSFAGV